MSDSANNTIFPFTLTDVVNSIRLVVSLGKDVKGVVDATSEAMQRGKGRKAAANLDVLAFKNDGSRKHLERIAEGRGTIADFEAIATKMNQTGEVVENAIASLRASRRFLRERYGMQVANKVDSLIYAGGGKASIRLDLELLARMEDSSFTPDAVANEARRILANIQSMNAGLEELHDLLIELDKGS